MAKQYRVNAFVRINNAMISSLLRLGIQVGSFSLLTVRGRKSGKQIETPLAVFVQDQKRYLIAPYGVGTGYATSERQKVWRRLPGDGTAKGFMPSNWSQRLRLPLFEKPCVLALPAFPQ